METSSKKLNIFFRTNFGTKVGLGHLIRCFKLANILKKKFNIFFVLDKKKEIVKVQDLIKDFNLIYLYEGNSKFTNEVLDANLFIKKTKNFKKFCVFVDDYRLASKWHIKIKKTVKKLIVIDDLLSKKFYSDYYINYKYKINQKTSIINKLNIKKNSKLILGENFNILSNSLKKNQKRKYIMVNFGNSFDFKKIKKFLTRLYIYSIKNKMKLLICIGRFAKNTKYIFNFKQSEYIKILNKEIFIENYLNQTKLFIGSAGAAIYEMSYLETPSIFLKTSNNQSNEINDLMDLGKFFYFKNYNNAENIFKILNIFKKNESRIKNLKLNKVNLKNDGIQKILKITKLLIK